VAIARRRRRAVPIVIATCIALALAAMAFYVDATRSMPLDMFN